MTGNRFSTTAEIYLAANESNEKIEDLDKVSILPSKRGVWDCYKTGIKRCNYKLHLCISPKHYKTHLSAIKKKLNNACMQRVISGYKHYNEEEYKIRHESYVECKDSLEAILNLIRCLTSRIPISYDLRKECEKYFGAVDLFDLESLYSIRDELHFNMKRLEKIRGTRLTNHSITIYLPYENNYAALAALCLDVEEELKKLPQKNSKLSIADIPLLLHISYRMVGMDTKYVKIASASENELAVLKALGEKSDFAEQLTKELDKQTSIKQSAKLPTLVMESKVKASQTKIVNDTSSRGAKLNFFLFHRFDAKTHEAKKNYPKALRRKSF